MAKRTHDTTMSSDLGGNWAGAGIKDVDVILLSNLCTELGADTEARSIGLSVEACADTDVMSFGDVGDRW